MPRLSLIELHKENMKFSSGHFTIFSAENRERMHGHNYTVYCGLETLIEENGLAFDYRIYKTKVYEICQKLNGAFLLAGHSPHLRFEEYDDHYWVYFHTEKLYFNKRDIVVLPIKNVTVEELSLWFIEQLTINKPELKQHGVQKITVKIASSPGQSGSASWIG
ncbi:MAG: 6-carboxytetrahydropterin synthase [Gammaproteobacteria bacterium]|nr:6-carboxytetrahydropterin synthase [Gammaproteobacteria bacterium]